MNTILDHQAGAGRRRRNHSDEFKARAVACCMRPGVSLAAVAMAQGVNANLLRRWVREAEAKSSNRAGSKLVAQRVKAPERSALFVPVGLPAATVPAPSPDIRIELQSGATSVTVTWPASLAHECAAWMRELLR